MFIRSKARVTGQQVNKSNKVGEEGTQSRLQNPQKQTMTRRVKEGWGGRRGVKEGWGGRGWDEWGGNGRGAGGDGSGGEVRIEGEDGS